MDAVNRTGVSSKIRIALDATYAAYPNRAGIGIYSEKLISALARCIPAALANSALTLAFRPGPYVKWTRRHSWPAPFAIAPLLDSWLRVPRATLFHGLNQRLPGTSYPLQVVTLHERYPNPSEQYSKAAFREHMARRIESAIRRADRIIAISDVVRKHLTAHRPEFAAKSVVIHHGVEPARPAAAEEITEFRHRQLHLAPEDRFFLSVGAVQTRKNVAGIVLAMKSLPGSRLVIAGGDGHGAGAIRSLIEREGMRERVLFLGHVNQPVLRMLYSSALALVFPSFEEAFGLPILEAMSYGLPVITSNVTAMPEVAGDAALLVAPHNTVEIAEAMQRLQDDSELRKDLIVRGKRRAAQFTWERCAQQTWAVYQELLEKRRADSQG